MSKVIVIVWSQWGDEGKGKIVDLLAERFEVVARYQGGHNAGHSVQVGERSFVLHLLPSGIIHEGKTCVLGNGMVIDPEALLEEIEKLRAMGVRNEENLKVSDAAHVILPYHRALERRAAHGQHDHRLPGTLRGDFLWCSAAGHASVHPAGRRVRPRPGPRLR